MLFSLGDTSDPNFVKEALLSERVDKALIESFIAAEYRHIFDHPDIVLEGIVQGNLAYGIALNGEAKRLTICMKRYFSEHQSEILWLLSKQLGPSEVCIIYKKHNFFCVLLALSYHIVA